MIRKTFVAVAAGAALVIAGAPATADVTPQQVTEPFRVTSGGFV